MCRKEARQGKASRDSVGKVHWERRRKGRLVGRKEGRKEEVVIVK